jgi:hypothetical protein
MTLNLDRMSYIVISDHRDGAYFPERNLCDTDRKTTVQDILRGQFGDVVKVIEWNAVEHICNDVTLDILAEVEAFREPERRCHATQEQIWDHARGLRVA